MGRRCLYPVLGPFVDRLYNWLQSAALFGQAILNAHWYLWIDDALDNTLGFKFAQSIAEDTVRQPFNGRRQFAKPPGAIQERIEDETCPTFPE